MRRLGWLLALACSSAWPQARLIPPLVGFLQDSQDRLRPLYGVAGNFLPGGPVLEGVISLAGSVRGTLVKRENELLWLDEAGEPKGRWETPPGEALFGFTRTGEPALVYFPATGRLDRIQADGLRLVAVVRQGVLSVGWAEGGRAALIVEEAGRRRLRLVEAGGGWVVSEFELDVDSGPALLTSEGAMVLAAGGELVVRLADGLERRLALPAPARCLRQLGDGWVEVRLEGEAGRLALRLDQEDGRLYRLPEAGP